jgi:anti-sigma regulatory factor (Ser/Thr protein kinase)
MGTILKLLLPPDASAPRLARGALHNLPSRIDRLLPTLELLITELVTNSVKHAGLLPSDHIELAIQDDENLLRVEVLDPGRGYDDAQAGWGRVRDGDGQPGLHEDGYGFHIVSREADRAGIQWNSGTLAWFELRVEPEV